MRSVEIHIFIAFPTGIISDTKKRGTQLIFLINKEKKIANHQEVWSCACTLIFQIFSPFTDDVIREE